MSYKDFTKMTVWSKAFVLLMLIYGVTKKINFIEKESDFKTILELSKSIITDI